jgi:hypothetical protein
MGDRLTGALAEIAIAAPADADDWWIIGSAAMVICGIEDLEPEDVDLLGSATTLSRCLDRWRVEPGQPRPGDRFRSQPYVRVELPGCLPIETMGDLHVFSQVGWQPMTPRTRAAVDVGGHRVFVPELQEQLDILQLFGRPKDLAKARMIEANLHSGIGQ